MLESKAHTTEKRLQMSLSFNHLIINLKKFTCEYCLCCKIYKEKNESQWKKTVKGNEKIKMVIESWQRNCIRWMEFMMKRIFNKIWPSLLEFQLKHKQNPNICWFKRASPDGRVKCQRSSLLFGLLRWYSCGMVLKCIFICPRCLQVPPELGEVGSNYIKWLKL